MTETPPLLGAPTNELCAVLDRWRATVDAELKGAPFEKKLVTRLADGIALNPLYSRADLANVPHLNAPPGTAPFFRGATALGYRERRWDVAQEIAADDAARFNAALLQDLMAGQNALRLTPDLAARAGCDPDEAPAAEVGKGGLSLCDAHDLSTALNGVALDAVPVYLATGADPLPIASLYLEYARSRGTPWTALRGSVTADPLGEWVTRGELSADLDALYVALAGWTDTASKQAPHLRTIGVSVQHWAEAGATTVQELAFALATGAEYLRALQLRGVSPACGAPRIDFDFAVGPQFFTEVAKFRAVRSAWTRVVIALGGRAQAAAMAGVGARTATWNKTLLDPHVNMLRATTEALSAVLGGCDRLHVAPFDEAAGGTTDFSRRIARNVHTLLAEEFNLAQTADPAGGSWYIEKLTDELARSAWKLFQDIESRGGMAAALRAGYPQHLVTHAALERKDAVAKRRYALVGTNLYPNLKESGLAPKALDAAANQLRRATEIRSRRKPASQSDAHEMDWPARFARALVDARLGATVGQLSRLTRRFKQRGEIITRVSTCRVAEAFELLRTASAAFAARAGGRPKVFLAKMGPVPQHKARADFATGFFQVGGFDVLGRESFATAEEAAAAAVTANAHVVVLCSTDETYPVIVPAFASALRAMRSDAILVLAGLPADAATKKTFIDAGIGEFIHVRSNLYEVLSLLLKRIGAFP